MLRSAEPPSLHTLETALIMSFSIINPYTRAVVRTLPWSTSAEVSHALTGLKGAGTKAQSAYAWSTGPDGVGGCNMPVCAGASLLVVHHQFSHDLVVLLPFRPLHPTLLHLPFSLLGRPLGPMLDTVSPRSHVPTY